MTRLVDGVLEAIDGLKAANDRLRTENTRLRKALFLVGGIVLGFEPQETTVFGKSYVEYWEMMRGFIREALELKQ